MLISAKMHCNWQNGIKKEKYFYKKINFNKVLKKCEKNCKNRLRKIKKATKTLDNKVVFMVSLQNI